MSTLNAILRYLIVFLNPGLVDGFLALLPHGRGPGTEVYGLSAKISGLEKRYAVAPRAVRTAGALFAFTKEPPLPFSEFCRRATAPD
jgi:hypothetical protein